LAAKSLGVLVTGGAGYIGSHAAKTLSRAGYQVVVFDNLAAGHREAVRYGELVEQLFRLRLGVVVGAHSTNSTFETFS